MLEMAVQILGYQQIKREQVFASGPVLELVRNTLEALLWLVASCRYAVVPARDTGGGSLKNMNDDSEPIPRKAAEIPEWELEEMIRDVITQAMRADIAERALAWLDRVDDLLAGLRKEMPDVIELVGLEKWHPSDDAW